MAGRRLSANGTVGEFIGQFTRGGAGVVSAKRMHNKEQVSRGSLRLCKMKELL